MLKGFLTLQLQGGDLKTENIQSTEQKTYKVQFYYTFGFNLHQPTEGEIFSSPFRAKTWNCCPLKSENTKLTFQSFLLFWKELGKKKTTNKQCKTHYFSCITNTLYQVNKTFLPFLLPVAPTAPYHALFVPHRQFLLKEFPPSASLFQSSQSEQR